MNVIILNVGDELLIGQVINTNAAWLGTILNENGFNVKEVLTVADRMEAINEGLDYCLERADLILMTGGLGPTKDDITKKALASYFGVDLVFHAPMFARIEKYFEKLNKKTTTSHREQCYLPTNAVLLKNNLGTAPGMWMEKEGKTIISMPGVPYEMHSIVENEVLPRINKRYHRGAIYHRTIHTIGMGETRIAQKIQHLIDGFPDYVKIAYLPSLGMVRTRLSGYHQDELVIKSYIDQKIIEISSLIPNIIYGYDGITIEEEIGNILRKKNLRLSTAESCTGGSIAALITSIPGSSDYFEGAVVSYSNQMKKNLLGVQDSTLKEHGAVSELTVLEMLKGVLTHSESDVGISVSGIAGPSGGTLKKPVGTIWIACGTIEQQHTEKIQLGRTRKINIEYTTTYALNMLRNFLLAQ